MADPRKFIIDTDYPTPAFVAKWEGSVPNVPAYDYKDSEFAHGLPFTPLIVGQWSLNANFEPAYDLATQNGYFVGVNFNQTTGSNASKIKFVLYNDYSTAKTFYYRIFAFAPPDYDGDIPAIEDSTNFRLNSDFNYPKLVAYDTANLTTGTNYVYNHNLGYIPQTRVWIYDSLEGMVIPVSNVYYQDGSYTSTAIVTSSKLEYNGSITGNKIYIHVYAEEA